ncbi:MAG: DNA primase [Candidatus Babeliales bacterium]
MNLFNYIKNNVSILEVISEYATLKKAGLYYKGVCPFHHEKTASFTVSPHKEIFYCFGCHIGGDVINFISKTEHCTPLQAAQFLIERYRLIIPKNISIDSDQDDRLDEKNRYHNLCQLIASWFHEQLIKSPALLRYLKSRGFEKNVIENYQIGYFPGGFKSIDRITTYAQKNNFLIEDLIVANLICEGKNILYSPFEERIIFPIKDNLGRICGFGGRVYKKDDDRPKYYNSRENKYFLKGSLLFGLDQAKKAIQQKEAVFLVEGYTDCLAMAQHGFLNTVATLGTACTLEHLKRISRYADTLFVLYDGDKAGQKAALRLTELSWQTNLELNIIKLPQGEDPASFLQKGADLPSLIAQSEDIFLFCLQSSTEGFFEKTINEKVTTIRHLMNIIVTIPDALKKEMLLQRASKAFDIPLLSLKKELILLAKQTQKPLNSYQEPDKEVENSENITLKTILQEIPILEKKLFSVIINNVDLMQPEDETYVETYLSQPLQVFFKKIKTEKKGGTNQFDFVQFFDVLNEKEKILISHLLLECQEYEGPENFEYLLEQFQKKNWKSFVMDTKIKLARAKQAQDEKTMRQILHQFQELKKKLLHKGLV